MSTSSKETTLFLVLPSSSFQPSSQRPDGCRAPRRWREDAPPLHRGVCCLPRGAGEEPPLGLREGDKKTRRLPIDSVAGDTKKKKKKRRTRWLSLAAPFPSPPTKFHPPATSRCQDLFLRHDAALPATRRTPRLLRHSVGARNVHDPPEDINPWKEVRGQQPGQ